MTRFVIISRLPFSPCTVIGVFLAVICRMVQCKQDRLTTTCPRNFVKEFFANITLRTSKVRTRYFACVRTCVCTPIGKERKKVTGAYSSERKRCIPRTVDCNGKNSEGGRMMRGRERGGDTRSREGGTRGRDDSSGIKSG